ncbi:uncharacterized protein LOC127802154 [Diospyros lotus]|uniref:uncharacterized protein LOC127802154 n=1 Tax=Diospyros lotus TaxID=55363 RepID=UPI00225640AC|nr:uncharacterized protein LOC127802154 [Diospyros lotus]
MAVTNSVFPIVSDTVFEFQPNLINMAANENNGNENRNNGNNANRSIRELAALDVHYQPLCIQYPQLEANFELKSGLIHLLPKFHGLAGEDPHKHLKEFHVVCSTMSPQGVDEEQIKLRAFPFSLDGAAKDWLYYLPPAAITNWDGLRRIFLEKFFPASRTEAIRKDICGIRQIDGESLHESWERFKKLYLVDAASGGALVEKTPAAARDLISKMAQNAQQFGTRYDNTESCNGIFPGRLFQHQPQQSRYDPYAPTYNPGWRDHPNFRYGGASTQPFQQRFNAPGQSNATPMKQQAQTLPKTESSLNDIVQQLAANTLKFQQRTDTTIQNLETQIGQLATNINELRSQGSGQLPSQPISNQKGNVSAIMLHSGKEVNAPEKAQEETGRKEESQPLSIQRAKQHINNDQDKGEHTYNNPLPFPHKATQNKKRAEAELDKEIMETFQKVEVNIPLLEAIRQIPKYAKFLKDLCTHKRKLKGNEQVNLGRNVSALIQLAMPLKCKDPGTFTIPCTIGKLQFTNALLDLGASINVMPKSVYASLQVSPLKSTGVVVQLANRSTVYPTGVLEDVLVKVKDLIFPADFYVLNMEDDNKIGHAPLILGRPFLKTARTIINVHEGTLSMEFAGNTIHFNILDSMKYPSEDHSS